jgi:hypothetical protein
MPSKTDLEQVRNKTDLTKALTDSFAYCDAVCAATTDANVGQLVTLAAASGGGEASRGAVLVFNTPRTTTSTMGSRRVPAPEGPCPTVNRKNTVEMSLPRAT